MPIVDGKKIVISDSTKKKKPQRISPWHIFTLPQPAPVVLGLSLNGENAERLILLEEMDPYHESLFLESVHYDRE